MLLGGLALYSAGIALMGMAPNYGFLLLAAVVAGLGNSVFHPADLGILNACVAQQRLGPAFSVHSITGNIGWALAPGVMTALALLFGWRGALLMASFAGIAVLLALWLAGTKIDDRRGAADTRSVAGPSGAQVLLQRSILLCFVFFTLLSSGLIGLQTFGIPTFVKLFGLSPAQAASAVTAFLLGGACGMLAGGMLASRASNHGVLAASGMGLAAAIVALMGLGVIPAVLVTAALALTGFCTGVTFPSRDLLVRSATPKGSTGKVYGFVYSGLDAGAAVAPVLFGWLLDHGQSVLVLAAVACAWAATIVTIFLIDREIN
jgi:MFS transporter, FSR family, fosmidomycin resistance protein